MTKAQHIAIQFYPSQCNATQYSTAQYNKIQTNIGQYNRVQYNKEVLGKVAIIEEEIRNKNQQRGTRKISIEVEGKEGLFLLSSSSVIVSSQRGDV